MTGIWVMTEADILELWAVHGANAITAFTVYISFTFGFLATAYFVGSQLTPFQAFVASGLYIISAGAPGLTQIAYIQTMFAILESGPNLLQGFTLVNGTFWVWFMSIVQGAGILISLYFMWSVRHPKTE
jgi:hypothetical protein